MFSKEKINIMNKYIKVQLVDTIIIIMKIVFIILIRYLK